ncbi:hypothetical protein G6F37_002120 [Rhizopus arrhizus]|nr:hypothetical protein G6F38_006722 [Rhizopus arrhizus]KAG1162468.1 hypothetical protein G6F37_002120 [Rhizopus arrhizus]
MSVIVEPSEELLFHSPFTRLSKESLFVKNLNDHPIIFKVKTTAPKQYCVRPNAGRIEPNSEIEVQIILQPFKEEPAEDYKCKDKFLVQTATLNESLEQQDISSMWSYIESTDRQSMHQHKIKCVFVGPKKEENEHVADDNVEKIAATTTPTTTTTTTTSANTDANTDADKTATDAAASAITAAAATTGITTTEQEPSEQVTANKEESQISSHNDVIPTSIVPPVPQQPAPPVEEAQVPSEPLQPTPVAAVPVREIEQEKESEEKKRLREALETIKRLEKEIEQLKKSQDEGLRERKEAVGGRKLAPTVQPLDAVHQHLAQLEKPRAVEGYPPQVMLGVAILVFIFTYLFF